MVQFLGPEIVIMVQFLVQIFFSRILANRKEKNNLHMLWVMHEFNKSKKTPFEIIKSELNRSGFSLKGFSILQYFCVHIIGENVNTNVTNGQHIIY